MFLPVPPDPEFYPSQIPDLGSNNRTKRGENFFFFPTISCCHKYHKIINNFIFEQVKNIFLAQTLRIEVFFTQKFFNKLSKIWVWDPDPGSEKIPIPDPGSRVQKSPDPGS
jgi:hypothetical protein